MARVRILKLIISGLFFGLILGLFYMQVIKAPLYIELAKNNRIRIIPVMGPRGNIFDREGRVIAGNRVSFDCVIIPRELTAREDTFSELSRILGTGKDILKKRLSQKAVNPFMPTVIARDISKSEAIAIEEERLDMPGVFVSTRPIRDYPYRDASAHLIGYIGEIGQAELDRLDRYGYRISDLIGKAGVEKEYDNYLKGKNGGMQIEVDNKGRQVRLLGSRNPEKGKDLYLTVDIELQKYINNLLQAKGSCIVINPENGEVLSLVSQPSFDPNLFVTSDNRIKRILNDPEKPMLNRAISCAYPPGSSFKVVTAMAALEERKIDIDRQFACDGSYKVGGRKFHCWREGGHGYQNVVTGIKNSCNVFFYNTGLLLGPDNISRYAEYFGFGRPAGIDLPEEAAGLVPNKLWKRLKMREKWYDGETANYAIGQGYVLVTPIQILRMISVIASGGFLVEPHVVKRIEEIDVTAAAQKKLDFSKRNIDILTSGLQKVVEEEGGTGARARVEGITIAGKTGTAQTGRGNRTHAWFVGFSPVDEPKIAVVVFLEEGGKGGLHASETAGQVFKKAKELNLL